MFKSAHTCLFIVLLKSVMLSAACYEPRGYKGINEAITAYKRRIDCAQRQLLNILACPIKKDRTQEEQPLFFAAHFTKTLDHDEKTGLLTKEGQLQYKKLLKALRTKKQRDFNAIKRHPGARIQFVNPQGAFTFSGIGSDSSLFTIPPFFSLSSAEAAAHMLEVYLMALARDVFFSDYGTGKKTDVHTSGISITKSAVRVLQDLGNHFVGPKNKYGNVTTAVLFRGETQGDLIGPYISQFLLLPLSLIFPSVSGAQVLSKNIRYTHQLRCIAQKREFGVSFKDFVALQNGKIPKTYVASDYDHKHMRYPVTGRDLASLTHYDRPYELYYNAVNILLAHQFPFSKVFPYSNGGAPNEAPLISMGTADVYALLGSIMLEALKAVWAQKWRIYRALRPEAFAGLIHYIKTTGIDPCNARLHSSLFVTHKGINVLELIRQKNEMQSLKIIDPTHSLSKKEASTYLLGQVYPQGAPAHPSYPAAHATVAGACITVLKALFDDTVKIKDKVVPVKVDPSDPTKLIPLRNEGENIMTVASELDKLASNIAFGRIFAGVHYRCDAIGLDLGESVAIKYLQDHACMYSEETFKGFEFYKRNGTRIRVTAYEITEVTPDTHKNL
jgi:hypothetical protein